MTDWNILGQIRQRQKLELAQEQALLAALAEIDPEHSDRPLERRLRNLRDPNRQQRRIHARNDRRRARLHGADYEPIDRHAVYKREHGTCHLCSKPVEEDAFHLEHVVPLALGGPHTYANVRIAHPSCNAAKGAHLLPTSDILR